MEASDNRFLEYFSPEGKARLIESIVEHQYHPNSFLFHEGDPADGVCLVLEGKVDILRTAGKREQILSHCEAGDFLGEVAVLDGHGRSTCARAQGHARIALIPKDRLLEVLHKESVSVTLHIFQQLLTYFRQTNDLFVKEVIYKEKLSLVGEMANSLMHDLRNPLTGIRISADLIDLQHADRETNHFCNGIRFQCDRVVAMAAELLEFSRGESKLKVEPTTTTLFIKQFIDLHEEYFRQTQVQFDIEADPAEIEIDAMRMLRLLQNLVTNSIEALADKLGGRIGIAARVEDGTFYLSVSDNGPGIPEEVRDRLFEPFVTQGKKSGTGLGMAIVDNVVTAHRGKIIFETSPEKGTLFLMEFPQYAPGGHDHSAKMVADAALNEPLLP